MLILVRKIDSNPGTKINIYDCCSKARKGNHQLSIRTRSQTNHKNHGVNTATRSMI
jgi:hypothetical protein